jgi:hypothetical protein
VGEPVSWRMAWRGVMERGGRSRSLKERSAPGRGSIADTTPTSRRKLKKLRRQRSGGTVGLAHLAQLELKEEI